jgi:D-alanyl-D-alanine carboxypeptidase
MAPMDARALLAAGVSLVLVLTGCSPAPIQVPTPRPTSTAPPVPTPTPRPQARVVGAPATRPTLAIVTPQTPPSSPTPVLEPTPEPQADAAEVPVLDGLLDGLLPDGDPAYGLVLEDVGSGARTAVNDAQAFPSASLYKLGVAWLALRDVDAGTLSLDDPLPVEDEDTVEPEPRGGFKAGDAPTVHEALEAMLSLSSNAAAHAFLRVLGRDRLNQEMDRIGLTQTRVPDDDDGEAVTSAADIARLLRLVSTSPELSAGAKEVLAHGMANVAPPDALRDTLPDSVGILDKTGNLPDSSNVGALLETSRGTVIVVVVDSGVTPGEARAVIAEMGQIAYHSLLE